ncbi:MAG: pitrilysin family protein [Saprospiraceae bacterium]
MKRNIFLALTAAITLLQCTPKTADQMSNTTKDTKTMSENFRKQAPAAGPAPKITMGQYESFTLDNGLKVIVVENHKLPKVSFMVDIDRGPVREDSLAGTASIAGSLLATGTTTKTKAQIDESIDFLGADLSTSSTGIRASGLKKHSDKILAIMSDVLLNPVFPADEFEKLKKQTISGLAASQDDPQAISSNVSNVLIYGKRHAYGEVVTDESVNKIKLKDCKNYYTKYFKPNISYLVIVGDITADEARTAANKYFGSWKKEGVPVTEFVRVNTPESTELDFVHKPGAVQSLVNVTYPVELRTGAPDGIAARVMNNILGGGNFSARLFQNLRESKAYTYGAYSSLNADPVIGSFSANASVRNEVTDSAVTQFLLEMNRMRTEPVSEADLKGIKDNMAGAFARSLERPETVANFALNIAKYGLPNDYYETYLQKLAAVSSADVQAAAQKYLQPEHAHIVVVGDKDEVADRLKTFSKVGTINYYDRNGNPIKDLSMKLPAGVRAETIINDYLTAIGGYPKLKTIKSLSKTYQAEMMGMKLEMTTVQTDKEQYMMVVMMNGSQMQKSSFDGTKGSEEAMGQKRAVTEAAELEDMRQSAKFFPEMFYLKSGNSFELKSIEDVNGSPAYKILITKADGKKSMEYYDVASKLKVREIQIQNDPEGNQMTVQNDYEDYQDDKGIKYPHQIVTVGIMPTPLVMKLSEIKINETIPDSTFKVD